MRKTDEDSLLKWWEETSLVPKLCCFGLPNDEVSTVKNQPAIPKIV